MFFVELRSAVNNKAIYNINFLLQYKVKFEQSYVSEIPQCSRCQQYGIQKISVFDKCVKCVEDRAIVKSSTKTRFQ